MSAVQDDYLLRMIRDAAIFLRRVFDARRRGSRGEALDTLDNAWFQLLGLPRNVAQRLDAASLARLLAIPERCTVAADLLETEAALCDQDGLTVEAASLRETARKLRIQPSISGIQEPDPEA